MIQVKPGPCSMIQSVPGGGNGGRKRGTESGAAMLTLTGLSCRFGPVTAVDDVTLAVPAGQVLGIIGPSGAGKSTLLRLINRLQAPSAGRIDCDGLDVTALRGAALRRWRGEAAMIFQGFNLIPRLDVLSNVLIGRLGHVGALRGLAGLFTAADRALALDLLDRYGLAERALERAGRLSGGEQQRVAICRALMQAPRLVLADEPVASLDPRNSRMVMDALRAIAREAGLTVLVNLHDLTLARAYCDRLVALAAGRVVFDGAPASLSAARIVEIYGMDETALAEAGLAPAPA